MSNYENFVADFPTRCAELLAFSHEKAELNHREVTLMLCIAMPSIVVPRERLKGPKTNSDGKPKFGHPSGDWKTFERAKTKLDELDEQNFLGSRIWPSAVNSWQFKKKVADPTAPLDDWPELKPPNLLKPEKKVKHVLEHLRNALAHGSIYTRGRKVDLIVFLSEETEGKNVYNMLAVEPEDFRIFLQNWLKFVGELKLPPELYADAA